jgi:hypothetical protein
VSCMKSHKMVLPLDCLLLTTTHMSVYCCIMMSVPGPVYNGLVDV